MDTYKKEKFAYIVAFSLAIFYFGWWGVNYFFGEVGDKAHELYSDTYWIVALVGVFYGFFASKLWGGLKSVFGRAIFLFSLGFLAQVFGQLTYSYYALVKDVEAPYPSIGDIGFFGSVVLYILGVFVLSRAVGARFKLAKTWQKLIAVAAPVALLITSYTIFLKDYENTGDTWVTILDFSYPLGQALYISLALLTYVLSAKLLGGKMKNKILLLLFALFVQYLADFTFLYRFSREEWYAGGPSDLLYQAAYLLMTIALLQIGGVVHKLKAGKAS